MPVSKSEKLIVVLGISLVTHQPSQVRNHDLYTFRNTQVQQTFILV